MEEIILCECGRDGKRVHCPHCGSTNTTGLVPKQDANGRYLRHFRCRKCGMLYFEGEPCIAPQLVSKTAERIARQIMNRPIKTEKDLRSPLRDTEKRTRFEEMLQENIRRAKEGLPLLGQRVGENVDEKALPTPDEEEPETLSSEKKTELKDLFQGEKP